MINPKTMLAPQSVLRTLGLTDSEKAFLSKLRDTVWDEIHKSHSGRFPSPEHTRATILVALSVLWIDAEALKKQVLS